LKSEKLFLVIVGEELLARIIYKPNKIVTEIEFILLF